jgi:hypothetical protein
MPTERSARNELGNFAKARGDNPQKWDSFSKGKKDESSFSQTILY